MPISALALPEEAATVTMVTMPEKVEYSVEPGTDLNLVGLPTALEVKTSRDIDGDGDSAAGALEEKAVIWQGDYDKDAAGVYTLTAAFADSDLVFNEMPKVSIKVEGPVVAELADRRGESRASHEETAKATDKIYVSSTGADNSATGSQERPYGTLAKAVEMVAPGGVVAIVNDLVINKGVRLVDKSVVIEAAGSMPVTVTRGDSFATTNDVARSWYNPAMIEVTGSSNLTLSNIVLDDAGKFEGTKFLSQTTEGGTSLNLSRVQDAIVSVYSGSSLRVVDTRLKNFGGMSAIRTAGKGIRVDMEGTSEITIDLASYTPQKRYAGVWAQGDDSTIFNMGSDAKITNLITPALSLDNTTAVVSGEISGNRATGITSNRGTVSIEESGTITNNTGSTLAGGIYANQGTKLNIRGKITNNSSLGRGGGIYVQGNGAGSTAVLEADGEISGNSSFKPGGGVNVDQASNFIMRGGSVVNNNAGDGTGSGIFLRRGARFTMEDGKVTGNGSEGEAPGKDIAIQGGIRDYGRMGYASLSEKAKDHIGPDQIYLADEKKSVFSTENSGLLTIGDLSAADKTNIKSSVTSVGLTYLESVWTKPESNVTAFEITRPETSNREEPFYAALVKTDDEANLLSDDYSYYAVAAAPTGRLSVSVPTPATTDNYAIAIVQGAGPVLTEQPESVYASYGESAAFKVEARASSGTVGYQWQKSVDDGITWTDVPGAHKATYTTSAVVDIDNENLYRCRVTGSVVPVTLYSDAAKLTVTLPIAISPSNTFEKGNAPDLTITVGSSLSVKASLNLNQVILGGGVLTEGSQYTSADGSIIVSLPSSYLNTLAVGTYALEITTKNTPYEKLSARAEITVTPQGATPSVFSPGDNASSSKSNENISKPTALPIPSTGDSIILVGAASGFCLVGVIVLIVALRRIKREDKAFL